MRQSSKGTLSFKNKFGYMMGDLANGLTFGMSAGFLLAFYTDALGITAAAAGLLFLVARIWDAINDPIMGALTDKMFKRRALKNKGKKVDKFRVYLLKGSWPVVLAAILMFFSPKGLNGAEKLVWAYVTYILWGMTYTFVNIPYGSLAAVMTQDPVERSSLAAARGLGGMLGGLLPRVIVPVILAGFVDGLSQGYLIVMVIFGVMSLISYLIAYFTVEEHVEYKVEEKQENTNIISSIKMIWSNRPFIAVSIATIAIIFGMMLTQAMGLFYYRENLNALSLMAIIGLASLIPTLIMTPLLPKLVKRFGTKKTAAYSSLMACLVNGVLMVIPDNAMVFSIGSLFIALFLVVPNMLVFGMVSDCIDYNQYLHGQRQEGVIYGFYSFVRKTGQALAGFIAGLGLSIVGYDASLSTQSTGTLFGIKFLNIGIPAVGLFIAFLAFKFIWNLTPEKQEEVRKHIS